MRSIKASFPTLLFAVTFFLPLAAGADDSATESFESLLSRLSPQLGSGDYGERTMAYGTLENKLTYMPITELPQAIHQLNTETRKNLSDLEASERLAQLADHVFDRLASVALEAAHSDVETTLETAIATIAKIDDAPQRKKIINRILDSTYPSETKIDILVSVGGVAVDPLITNLNDENIIVRRAAARSLGKIKDDKSVGPLTSALYDNARSVRVEAANALGNIGNPKALSPIENLLKTAFDDDEERGAFLAALLLIKNDPMDPLLKELNNENFVVREYLAYQLGYKSDNGRAVAPLLSLLSDADVGVRDAALNGLRRLRHPTAVDPLIAKLNDDAWPEMRSDIASTLGKIGDRKAVAPLIALLGNESFFDRRAAIEALGELGDPQATDSIIPLLKDDNALIRRESAEALGKIGNQKALDALIKQALAHPDAESRIYAIWALQRIKDPAILPVLMVALGDLDSGVRAAAQRNLQLFHNAYCREEKK